MGTPDSNVPATATSENAPPARRRPLRRRLVRLVVLVLGGYVGLIVVLLFLENALLFHPVKAAEDWQSPPEPGVQDVELRSADGTRLHAWWYPHERSRGVLLYCHGNAGNLSSRADEVAAWHERMGFSVLIFDYPGYGKSQGRPSEVGCYAAADAAHDWLREQHHVAADRIIIYGGSLGGAVAVDLATRRPCQALVLRCTFTSVPDMAQTLYPWLPARWLVRSRFDSLAKIRHVTRPVFIAHGNCDTLVPFAQGQRLFEAANDPKCFFPMTGCGHNDRPGPEFFHALAGFLDGVGAPAR
jgi:fermentation-respiration switch protein FrsA (DUF1100 family)